MNRISRRSKRRKLMSEINMTPYIGVTFVLLIIFMLPTPLQQSRAAEVKLLTPRAETKIEQKQPPVIISIQKDGQYYLSEKELPKKPVLLPELLARLSTLQKNNPQAQIYLKADNTIDYGKIISLMTALKKAGVPQVGLVTSPLEL